MIKEFIERWQTRRAFSQVVSKESMDSILSGNIDESELRKLKESHLEFVFIAVRGSNAQQTAERMGTIADLSVEHGGGVDSLVSSLVIVVFGMFPNDSLRNRLTLVSTLQDRFGSEIKIVHGSAKGHHGNIGSGNRKSYSFIIPNFLDAIKQLSSANFGDVKEISKAG